jgi:hypothetical protein
MSLGPVPGDVEKWHFLTPPGLELRLPDISALRSAISITLSRLILKLSSCKKQDSVTTTIISFTVNGVEFIKSESFRLSSPVC